MARPASVRIMEDLRKARVLVIHPRDEDGEALVAHLKRFGCAVSALWSLPDSLPRDADAIFVETGSFAVDRLSNLFEETTAAIVAIMTYESPTALNAIVDLNAHGVISKPLRPLGILHQFALARYRQGIEQRLSGKVAKLEETLKSRRLVEQAVRILSSSQGLSEDEAYKMLRNHATSQRVAMADVANSLIKAHETMNGLGLAITAQVK